MSGWVKIHRSLLDWQWYKFPIHRALFLHCILKANHKDKYLGKTLVKRGSFVTSIDILASEICVSKTTLYRVLKDLESTSEVKRQSNNKGTIITITYYDKYQLSETPSVLPGVQQMERQVYTNKNVKKGRNIYIPEPLDYLNNALGTNYRHASQKTKSLVQARLREGFCLDDFKKVIDVKTKQWRLDPEMKKYLRPETLFGNKFESYLQEFKSQSTTHKSEIKKVDCAHCSGSGRISLFKRSGGETYTFRCICPNGAKYKAFPVVSGASKSIYTKNLSEVTQKVGSH